MKGAYIWGGGKGYIILVCIFCGQVGKLITRGLVSGGAYTQAAVSKCIANWKKETEFTSPAGSVDAMIFRWAMLEFHLIEGTWWRERIDKPY